jgi:hypothetical protein
MFKILSSLSVCQEERKRSLSGKDKNRQIAKSKFETTTFKKGG